MADAHTRERSMSGEPEDSDFESQMGANDGVNSPAKPGRKKNPNTQAARRDQNRIAQREFRLRKQQRIRDLEARVEILSGGQGEALAEIRGILRDLMQENHTLRGLLRSFAGFIGDGSGGLLSRMGWSLDDFNNFVNRSETDTAWESYQSRRKAKASNPEPQSAKRPAAGDLVEGQNKRPRNMSEQAKDADGPDFPLLAPLSASTPSSASLPPIQSHPYGAGSPVFIQSPSATSPTAYRGPSSSAYPQGYMPSLGMNVEATLPQIPYNPVQNGSIQRRISQSQSSPAPKDVIDDDDPAGDETYKLVRYHLENFKRNSAYCLPQSLRPTVLQRSIPHEGIIDLIVHPELRDRMIMTRGQLDLVDCLYDYRKAISIHGDDVLAHTNWEIGETWLRKYGFLIDQATLNICNRWRKERGEPELHLSDIAPQDHPSSTV